MARRDACGEPSTKTAHVCFLRVRMRLVARGSEHVQGGEAGTSERWVGVAGYSSSSSRRPRGVRGGSDGCPSARGKAPVIPSPCLFLRSSTSPRDA